MARDERYCDHAGDKEVGRRARAVSMQAYINGGGQTNDGTNDRRCREHAGGICAVRWVNAVSMQEAHIKWGWTNKQRF